MNWFRQLLTRRKLYDDLSQEIAQHLREKMDELVAGGMSRQEAEDTARREFGNMTLTEESGREVWRWPTGENFLMDVRYALRMLRQNPGFTCVAILTLALGIGANTAIFSVINAVLLRTLPVRDPQQLVVLTDPEEEGVWVGSSDGERIMLTEHEFEGLRDQNEVFSGVFATCSSLRTANVSVGSNSSEVGSPAKISMVSGTYWSVLGIEPLKGTMFGPEVDQGLGAHPVAVISYAFWQRRMQQDRAAVGRQLRVRQTVFDIVGVMPPDFTGITVGESPDIWVPIMMQQQIAPGSDWLTWKPGAFAKTMFLQVVGRLKPGVSVEQARASINVTFQQILHFEAGSISSEDKKREMFSNFIVLHSGSRGLSALRGEYSAPLEVMMGLVGLLLLLAAANVANLLLARANARQREITLRVALGAGRGRLIRQLLTESVLLAGIGGLAGIGLAYWADRLLLHMVSTSATPVPLDIHPDTSVLLFALGVSLITGILFGLAPALRATRLNLSDVLRGSSRSISGDAQGETRFPMGKLLVGAQVAISLLLLVSAGLFVRSLQKLSSIPLGYDPQGMLLFHMSPGVAGYKGAAVSQLYQQLLPKFAAVPGVRGVTLSDNGLFYGSDSEDPIEIAGYPPKAGQDIDAHFDEIGPKYFATIGIPVLAGRDVDEHDTTGAPVCWVNQSFAKYFLGNENPIGKRLSVDYRGTKPGFQIVGVVADVKSDDLHEETPRRFYVPYFHALDAPGSSFFEVRYGGNPAAVVAELRRITREADSTLDALDIQTLPQLLDRGMVRDRLTARLSAFFGVLALVLACIGLYGVLSYNVARRTSEIGVRMALGAQRRDVLRLVLGDALLVTGIGVAVGLAAAVAGTRLLSTLLFGLTPRDPVTLAGSVAGLLIAAMVAACVPAWRASRVDPMTALRHE
jgi:predicted permease